MRPIGAAVVGTGFIGPVHVEAIRRLGHHVVGILGSTEAKSQRAADSLGLTKAYPSLSAVLADPSVEVVHLATPNRDHFSQCQAVISAGKHVVCEKPLGMTSDETAELVRLAGSRPDLVAAVNYNVRFYPMLLDARAKIRRGDLGRILHVSGSYFQDWLLKDTDFNWRILSESGGALRAMADIGSHWLDTIRFLTGTPIASVCADLLTVHPIRHQPSGSRETFAGADHSNRETRPVDVSTDDAGLMLFRLACGGRGSLCVSQTMAGRKNDIRIEIAGDRQSFSWDSSQPNESMLGGRDDFPTLLTRDPARLEEAGFSDYPAGHAEGFPDSFKMLYRAIYAEIASRRDGRIDPRPLFATFADGHEQVVLGEAILRSHRERRWVELP